MTEIAENEKNGVLSPFQRSAFFRKMPTPDEFLEKSFCISRKRFELNMRI